MPRDYVSHLVVEGEKRMVSMNNILYLKGYRFCQSSYDNEGATVLSVNYDPYGITLSYAGYILFALGGLFSDAVAARPFQNNVAFSGDCHDSDMRMR